MNPGIRGFPVNGQHQAPYRFLDTYGLPDMPGDVSRFSAAHVRADAGAALPGVWRPVDATDIAGLSVNRGCLQVQGDIGAAVAGHTQISVADLDVVLEILPEYPFRNALAEYTVGVYVGVAGVGHLVAVDVRTANKILLDEGGVSRDIPAVTVRHGTIDLTSAALPVTLVTFGADSFNDVVGRVPCVLFRVKQRTGVTYLYYSFDGYGWKLAHTAPAAGTSLGIYVNAAAGVSLWRVRVAGMKFLDPSLNPPD